MSTDASRVLVYSDDPAVREQVLIAVGRRPDASLPPIEWVAVSDIKAVLRAVDAGDIEVCVLDAEAAPMGGMGISRQLKNEVRDCPAMLLLLARRDDRWLAKWSLADAVAMAPVDPVELTEALVGLLHQRRRAAAAADEGGALPAHRP